MTALNLTFLAQFNFGFDLLFYVTFNATLLVNTKEWNKNRREFF